MDLKKIKNFIKLAKEEGVTSLKYQEGEVKCEVSFNGHHSVQAYTPAPITATQSSSEPKNTNTSESFFEVRSPLVGTFYSSSSPDKPSYVNVGDKVSKGATLCILEAMKIMNEIESDVSGEIVEVCVENESLVEFDQVLFKVRV